MKIKNGVNSVASDGILLRSRNQHLPDLAGEGRTCGPVVRKASKLRRPASNRNVEQEWVARSVKNLAKARFDTLKRWRMESDNGSKGVSRFGQECLHCTELVSFPPPPTKAKQNAPG